MPSFGAAAEPPRTPGSRRARKDPAPSGAFRAPGAPPRTEQGQSAPLPVPLPPPVRFPARFSERLPVPPPARHPPGAPPGAHGQAIPGTPVRAGSMPRGPSWTQAEVDSLLLLVRDSGESALLMASTSRPNEALWREICQGLAAAGYERTVAQCRSKWKALKQAFHLERERRRRAGLRSALLPSHYRAMKSIWKAARQPVFGERRMPVEMRLPSRGRGSALATRSPSSPEPPGSPHGVGRNTPNLLLPPMLQRVKDEPETCFPGETSLGMGRGNQALPLAAAATGSHGTAATSEQPAAGSGVTGLPQNVQQLLLEILYISQQQQALLENLYHSIVEMGETLRQLLLQTHTYPCPLCHCVPPMPLFKGASGVPYHPGAPHTSPDHKEKL
ncbi:homeobox protein Hox-A3-like [Melozone crissalis]|uniref:homeobox protein Hox-A3-like n=1 Tax=Melozone crissalis TaxID=40204 RepID=UPI0023DA1010|nr:homeobox protein Hox-A3-like [Melozone crissalis]